MRTGFLLDTSFLSHLYPGRGARPDKLGAWVIENEYRFHLSSIAVAEVLSGVEKLWRRKDGRARIYESWIEETISIFDDRFFDFDLAAARVAGGLLDRAKAKGVNPGFADIAIAATASVHNLIILTSNVKHFADLGVPFADPFEALPR